MHVPSFLKTRMLKSTSLQTLISKFPERDGKDKPFSKKGHVSLDEGSDAGLANTSVETLVDATQSPSFKSAENHGSDKSASKKGSVQVDGSDAVSANTSVHNLVDAPQSPTIPRMKVSIGNDHLYIPVHLLQQRAPNLLRKYQTPSGVVITGILNPSKDPSLPYLLEAWLLHGKLTEVSEDFKVTEANHRDTHYMLQSLYYLFIMAQQLGINILEDYIMNSLARMKMNIWDFFIFGGYITDLIYKCTTGPCGLRLWCIRSLVYYQHQCSELEAKDFEIISKNPFIMRDFFKELATQRASGKAPMHPIGFPTTSYHHASFARSP